MLAGYQTFDYDSSLSREEGKKVSQEVVLSLGALGLFSRVYEQSIETLYDAYSVCSPRAGSLLFHCITLGWIQGMYEESNDMLS